MTQQDDRALAEFRGFALVADVYVREVTDADTLQMLEKIVEQLQTTLHKRKKVVFS